MSLLFSMLSRLVITFLPRSKHLLISWLHSASAVILDPPPLQKKKKYKVCRCFHCFPIYLPWSDGTRCHDLSFWTLSFKPTLSLSSFTFIKSLFSSSLLSAIRLVSSVYLRLLIFLPAILIPACASSNPVILMMCSVYKLNMQVDNIEPWRMPFTIWKHSVFPCTLLTVASWPAYRSLSRQVMSSGIRSIEEFSTVSCDLHSQRLWRNQKADIFL